MRHVRDRVDVSVRSLRQCPTEGGENSLVITWLRQLFLCGSRHHVS